MTQNINVGRIFIKGIVIFLLVEFALLSSWPDISALNVYALLRIKRERFPFSTQAPADAALDVGNLDAMFASHIVSEPKKPNEYRIFILGDSSVWGIRMNTQQTLSEQINKLNLTCNNKFAKSYNLSFPLSSASKDLMILDKAMAYQPDLIIWFVTLNTLSPKARLNNILIAQNPVEFYQLGKQYNFLPRKYKPPTLLDYVSEKQRSLFHLFQYQAYSLVQLATGKDQIQFPLAPTRPTELSNNINFDGLRPPVLSLSNISLDQIQDFYERVGNTPILLVNEPILIMNKIPNSDVRYNEYYPRWIYDQYRFYLADAASQNKWNYLDLWNFLSPDFFTNTPLHISPNGEYQLAKKLAPAIQKLCP